MKLKLDFISLRVDDVIASQTFYTELFGLSDDAVSSGDDHVSITGENGISLVLYAKKSFDAFPRNTPVQGGSGAILSTVVASTEEVDTLYRRALELGGVDVKSPAKEEYGYAAYIEDPDGHLWEIVA